MEATPHDLLRENYSRVAARLLDGLIEFLSAGRRRYGDMERLLLLITIAQRAYSDPRFAEAALGRGSLDVEGLTPLSTNILSLAKASSLPRETVRRKINELVESGVVTRVGGGVALTPGGVEGLAQARKALIEFTVRQHDIVAKLRAETGTLPDGPRSP